MTTLRPLIVLLALSVLPTLAGCGGGAASGSGADRNVIGHLELQEVPELNALEAIRRLRPAWLRVRNQPGGFSTQGGGSSHPKVHVDGVPIQDISQLQGISADEVREMRFVRGRDATTRWGTGYTNGVILVETES